MKKSVFLTIAVVLVCMSFLVISCAKQAAPAEGAAAEAGSLPTIKEGVLTVGSDCTWQPMEFIEGDQIVGFDVDIAAEIAERLGLELDYQNTGWDGLFPALIVNKFDMAISSITITDDRKKEMDFSIPYFTTDQAVAAMTGSDIDSEAKLDGKTAGVQIGTTGEIVAREIEGLSVKTYDDIIMVFEDLRAGRIDAAIADSYLGLYFAENDDDFVVDLVIKTDEQLGIAFAKDNEQMVDAVNSALQSMMDDGTYDTIFAKWFGEK
jgi:ABC-type amino acid transport substrate-binding protein